MKKVEELLHLEINRFIYPDYIQGQIKNRQDKIKMYLKEISLLMETDAMSNFGNSINLELQNNDKLPFPDCVIEMIYRFAKENCICNIDFKHIGRYFYIVKIPSDCSIVDAYKICKQMNVNVTKVMDDIFLIGNLKDIIK